MSSFSFFTFLAKDVDFKFCYPYNNTHISLLFVYSCPLFKVIKFLAAARCGFYIATLDIYMRLYVSMAYVD